MTMKNTKNSRQVLKNALKGLGVSALMTLPSFGLFAQHNFEFVNNGSVVSNFTTLSVWGDMHQLGNSLYRNDGTAQVQGNMYSSNTFQQRGNGTTVIQNLNVNGGQQQFIQGSYAVRGGQANVGVNDGSFYNLVLGNSQGVVWLNGTGEVADVRNSVDFQFGAAPVNRIITHNPSTLPTNGTGYSATFGIMNPSAGLGSMVDNTVTLNGNVSAVDNGYVQGRLRRAVSSAGGQYGFVLGLEPAGAGAARGMQYARIDLDANNYDVIYGLFEQGSDNTIAGSPGECGNAINYFGGLDHGEWYFNDITAAGAGTYQMWVWPQDDNYPANSSWFITKNDTILGLQNDCGTSPLGLDRNDFDGFGARSEFNLAAGSTALPVEIVDLFARPVENRYINVGWLTAMEIHSSHFEVERSLDLVGWNQVGSVDAAGNSSTLRRYGFDDVNVVAGIDYHYRLKYVDVDGSSNYTQSVTARLEPDQSYYGLNVWPNPVGDQGMQVTLGVQEDQEVRVEIYDAIGKQVWVGKEQLVAGNNEFHIPSNQLAHGSYHLKFVGKDFDASKKVIKINQ